MVRWCWGAIESCTELCNWLQQWRTMHNGHGHDDVVSLGFGGHGHDDVVSLGFGGLV